MIIQHNLQAMNANRMLGLTTAGQSKTAEKLSSGYRINRAADDAAGLSISEKMRKQIRGLDQASTNAQDGISAVQTAEGALTEVHNMLQRMNELAVQAANGTNSLSDRMSIQDEVDQLLTEIDRVAETTKFNETYLLKGNGKTATLTIPAKDAGLKGILTGAGSGTAVFDFEKPELGQFVTIGAREYLLGTEMEDIKTIIDNLDPSKTGLNNNTVTLNGTEYKIGTDTNFHENIYNKQDLCSLIKEGDRIIIGTRTYAAMTDSDYDGYDDNNASIISPSRLMRLVADELEKASSIGTAPGKGAVVTEKGMLIYNPAPVTKIFFIIQEGTVKTDQGLQIGIHAGADADGTNKISFKIDTMNSAGLGIKGLSLADDSGAMATYAIDSIADAISKVSAQRSLLGAIQNRLEHTIANLDNVVENTTAAESRIRDTDMAETMVDHSKLNILAQAGQSMLTQANQQTRNIVGLLQ